MEGIEFDYVCARCLGSRDVLTSPDLPRVCPNCGATDGWVGPVALDRFGRRANGEAMVDSPFYLAAQGEAAASG